MAQLIDDIFWGHGGHPYGNVLIPYILYCPEDPVKKCLAASTVVSVPQVLLVGDTVKNAVRTGYWPADHRFLLRRRGLGVHQSKFGFTVIPHASSSHSGT